MRFKNIFVSSATFCLASLMAPASAAAASYVASSNTLTFTGIDYTVASSGDSSTLLTDTQSDIEATPWYGKGQASASDIALVIDTDLGTPNGVRAPFVVYEITDSAIKWQAYDENTEAAFSGNNSLALKGEWLSATRIGYSQAALQSLVTTNQGLASTFSVTNLLVNGLHSHPMNRYVSPQQKAFWIAGDMGSDSHGDRDGSLRVGELGAGYNLGPVQLNIALGRTRADQKLLHSGEIEADGTYVMLESVLPISMKKDIYATLGTYHLYNRLNIRRGYLDGSAQEYSSAAPTSSAIGGRARIDWVDMLSWNRTKFSGYSDVYYSRNTLDAYTETAGSAPAQFHKRKDDITEARVGVSSKTSLPSTRFYLITDLEAAHRINDNAPSTTGEILGTGLGFDIAGQSYQQHWLKLGAGLEGTIGKGKLSAILNGTTRSEKSDVWGAISYTISW